MYHVTATIGCINIPLSLTSTKSSTHTTQEDVQLMPGITEQIRRGWTTHIVVFGANGISEVSSSMRNQLKEINTDAEMIVAQGMSLTKIQNTVEENSTAPSPGGGDVAAAASSLATSEWNGCSSLGDVLIQRNVFIDIGTSLKKRKKVF